MIHLSPLATCHHHDLLFMQHNEAIRHRHSVNRTAFAWWRKACLASSALPHRTEPGTRVAMHLYASFSHLCLFLGYQNPCGPSREKTFESQVQDHVLGLRGPQIPKEHDEDGAIAIRG